MGADRPTHPSLENCTTNWNAHCTAVPRLYLSDPLFSLLHNGVSVVITGMDRNSLTVGWNKWNSNVYSTIRWEGSSISRRGNAIDNNWEWRAVSSTLIVNGSTFNFSCWWEITMRYFRNPWLYIIHRSLKRPSKSLLQISTRELRSYIRSLVNYAFFKYILGYLQIDRY